MELYRVDIERYKNLRNCHVDFSNCGRLAVLAGVNGSGKSNFIEAVALLFQELLERDRPIANIGNAKAIFSSSDGEYEILRRDDDPLLVNNAFHDYAERPSMRLIASYSGEFNRLFDLGLESERDKIYRNDCAFVVSGKSFPVMLLTKVIVSKGKRRTQDGCLVSLPKAVRVSFWIEKPTLSFSEPPDDEIEDVLRGIHQNAGPSAISYIEMEIDKFESEIKSVISDWDSLNAGTIYYLLNELIRERSDNLQLKDIGIIFESSSGIEYTSADLSEGEKWLAMYDTIYSCLADENTLVLLDEPDAYIHETKKRDFVRFVQGCSERGVFTIMTSHSPNIINAVDERSLFGFIKNADESVSVNIATDRALQRLLIDDRMIYFSSKPIMLFEGISDLRLITSATEYFINHYPEYGRNRAKLNFDFFSMGSADNMVDAYHAFHAAFPARRIFIALDHDKKGKGVLQHLVNDCGLLNISEGGVENLRQDAAFLLPRPIGLGDNEDVYVIEDYLPCEFIQEKVKEYMSRATRFSKVDNCRESIKTEIRKNYVRFIERDWRGFKPLIDFLIQLPT